MHVCEREFSLCQLIIIYFSFQCCSINLFLSTDFLFTLRLLIEMLNTTGQRIDTYQTQLEHSIILVGIWAVRS